MNPFLALLGLPRWAKLALFGAVLVGLVLILHECAVRNAVEADRAESRAAAVERAREADQRADQASNTTKDAIQRSNTDAKAAADRSDDPLAAGLDSLRAQKDRGGKATRRAD